MSVRSLRHQRFRAIVLWGIGCTALIQVATGFTIDLALPRVRDPEYVHREALLRQQLGESPEKPVIVAIGSSRIKYGLDATSATRALGNHVQVFNFGITTSGPFLEQVVLKRLTEDHLKPDIVLIEVMPVHYNGKQLPADLESLDGARLSAEELAPLPQSKAALTGPLWRWARSRAWPSCRHQAELRDLLSPALGQSSKDSEIHAVDSLGWQACPTPTQGVAAMTDLAHRQYDKRFADFEMSLEQLHRLEQILLDCQRQNIKAALLLTPEGSEFRRLYSPAMTAAIDQMLRDLEKQFDVPIMDCRTWMPDEAFFDQHHLLSAGATQFSERLGREALQPMLKNLLK